MRITIVTGPFFSLPPAPCGAIERLFHDLGVRFAEVGHDVTFVCRSYPGLPGDETINGVRYIRRGGFDRTGRLSVDLIKDFFYSLRLLPILPAGDVISMNVFWLPAMALRLRRNIGKVIVNVHRFPKKQLKLYKGVARFATVSRAIGDAIAEQFPSAAPITRVFPNPIDAKVFVPPENPRPLDGSRTIVYTGRVHPEKGLHLLVDAFAQLYPMFPFLRLQLIGPSSISHGGGGDAFIQSLRKRAEGLPLEIVEPIYDRQKLADTLRAAHYYCYPSTAEKGEAQPVAPLEAMATGLVPIVSDLTCYNDFIENEKSGLIFDHRGADASTKLADALRQAILDPQRTAEMGRTAAQVAKNLSVEKIADMYLRDFEELVRGGQVASPRLEGAAQ